MHVRTRRAQHRLDGSEPFPRTDSLWITTTDTDGVNLGGTGPREGDDRIIRIEIER
jgi:hypothetical protein